eukprot:m.311776 g.311776  ORF g.311776 m.311776 type:complete len:78 (+) comp20230_c0_seq2:1669-1902(+)
MNAFGKACIITALCEGVAIADRFTALFNQPCSLCFSTTQTTIAWRILMRLHFLLVQQKTNLHHHATPTCVDYTSHRG